MKELTGLFGRLILAFLGVVAPLFVILLSVFREGMALLSSRYANERNQAQTNLVAQLKELDSKSNVEDVEQTIKKLKVNKKSAEKKMRRLSPRLQILSTFLPFFVAFVFLLVSSSFTDNYYKASFLCVSGITFCYGLYTLWWLLDVLIEVRKSISDRDGETKTNERELAAKNIDLLTSLSITMLELRKMLDGQGGSQSKSEELLKLIAESESKRFLKNVQLIINGQPTDQPGAKTSIPQNKPSPLKITLLNTEPRMAKDVEIGLIFSPDFLIEKSDKFSIYSDESTQVVRYQFSPVHGNTRQILSPLTVTAMKKTDTRVRTFIKAENIETITGFVTINVTDS